MFLVCWLFRGELGLDGELGWKRDCSSYVKYSCKLDGWDLMVYNSVRIIPMLGSPQRGSDLNWDNLYCQAIFAFLCELFVQSCSVPGFQWCLEPRALTIWTAIRALLYFSIAWTVTVDNLLWKTFYLCPIESARLRMDPCAKWTPIQSLSSNGHFADGDSGAP